MNIAFIIGCARSGTSIFGELISSHPDVKYIWEAHSIWEVGGEGENESHRFTEKHATPGVIKSVRQAAREWIEEKGCLKSLTVEKNPRNTLRVPYIRKIFPEAKIIHIVRDGRDVACSLLAGIGGPEWRHLKPPSWKSLMDEEPIIRCAKAWRDTMQIALDDLSAVPHLQVKYKDLILSPEKIASTTFDYLDLKNNVTVLEFCNKIQNATHDSYHALKQDRWYKNNHAFRVGRWKENLSSEQQIRVKKILENTLTRLNYSVSVPSG